MTIRRIVQTTFVTLTAVATLSCGGSPDSTASNYAVSGPAAAAVAPTRQTPRETLPAGAGMIPCAQD